MTNKVVYIYNMFVCTRSQNISFVSCACVCACLCQVSVVRPRGDRRSTSPVRADDTGSPQRQQQTSNPRCTSHPPPAPPRGSVAALQDAASPASPPQRSPATRPPGEHQPSPTQDVNGAHEQRRTSTSQQQQQQQRNSFRAADDCTKLRMQYVRTSYCTAAVDKPVRSTSLYHCRQCSIVLGLLAGIAQTRPSFVLTYDCSRKLRKHSTSAS